MTENWDAILMTAPAVIIPAVIGIVAWQNRTIRPIASKLFLAAAACQFLQLSLSLLQMLLGMNDLSYSPDGGDVDVFDPELQKLMAWQVMMAGFDIAAWSLMAWAILMRPDEGRISRPS